MTSYDLLHALGFALAVLTVPGSALLLVLTLAGARTPPAPSRSARPRGRAVVVVPAHDEAAGIAATVAHLRDATAQDGACALVVVADNCRDATAERARAAGARVLVRDDPARRGKGYALHHAFERLQPEGYDLFLVVDADSRLEPGFLQAMRCAFASGALAAQARYTVLNTEDSARTRLMSVALAAFNVLRPRGRAALGLSAGIYGNGFALHRDALRAVPYRAGSLIEDVEYHLMLVRAGVKVAFVDGATVRAEMPSRGAGVGTQRARWEGGRLGLAAKMIPTLARGVLRGRWAELEPLADLALPPLAYHATALGALLLLPALRLLAGALASVPAYLLWKIALLPHTLRAARARSPWVRTARAER